MIPYVKILASREKAAARPCHGHGRRNRCHRHSTNHKVHFCMEHERSFSKEKNEKKQIPSV